MFKYLNIKMKVGLVAAALAAANLLVFLPANNPASDFVIAPGSSTQAISAALKQAGLIHSVTVFRAYAWLTGNDRQFQAGRYSIPARINPYRLTRMFARGDFQPEGELVTLPEGLNVAEMDKVLAEQEIIPRGGLLAEMFKNLNISEGDLFPDTYRFKPNTPVAAVVRRLRDNFKKKTESFQLQVSSSKFHDAIIIASILEKEVRKPEDMKLVAGIIERRLKLGMPLEIDATVAYGVCLNVWTAPVQRTCVVTQVNLVDNIPKDSAYNTYRRAGLPPGPISNPGLNAIGAALQPQASDYLYYLTARDGTTVYAKTSAEQARNRRKYLNI